MLKDAFRKKAWLDSLERQALFYIKKTPTLSGGVFNNYIFLTKTVTPFCSSRGATVKNNFKMAKLSKKTVKSQANGQILDDFLKGVSNMSPIFVVVAIMIAYAFSAIVDFKYYSDFVFAPLQDNGMSMFLGAFVSAFIFFVRAVTAFHSINMFSRGNKKAGVLSFALTISITIFLLWEAPKEAQALCSTYPINLDAGINILRCIVAISFVMEILVISSVWEKIVSNEDAEDSDEEDEELEIVTHHKPSQNGQHNGLGKPHPSYQ